MVTIAWALSDADGGARRFSISWVERAGPPVVAAKRRGFGTNVIEKLSRLSLDAEVVFNLAREGLSWRLDCPAARVLADGVPGPSTGAAG
ncbi:MAG: hypothetical protein O3A88_04025 [Proteobacteria bacterium]|nr:hypothetical protein [Pseudomonadota bacterium]